MVSSCPAASVHSAHGAVSPPLLTLRGAPSEKPVRGAPTEPQTAGGGQQTKAGRQQEPPRAAPSLGFLCRGLLQLPLHAAPRTTLCVGECAVCHGFTWGNIFAVNVIAPVEPFQPSIIFCVDTRCHPGDLQVGFLVENPLSSALYELIQWFRRTK